MIPLFPCFIFAFTELGKSVRNDRYVRYERQRLGSFVGSRAGRRSELPGVSENYASWARKEGYQGKEIFDMSFTLIDITVQVIVNH